MCQSTVLIIFAILVALVPCNRAQEEEALSLVKAALGTIRESSYNEGDVAYNLGIDFADTVNTLGAKVVPPGPIQEYTTIIRYLFNYFVQNAHQAFFQCKSTIFNIIKLINERVQQVYGCSDIDLRASYATFLSNEGHGDLIIANSNKRIEEIIDQNINIMLALENESLTVLQKPGLLEDVLERYSDAVKQLASETASELSDRRSRLRSLTDRGLEFVLLDVKRQLDSKLQTCSVETPTC